MEAYTDYSASRLSGPTNVNEVHRLRFLGTLFLTSENRLLLCNVLWKESYRRHITGDPLVVLTWKYSITVVHYVRAVLDIFSCVGHRAPTYSVGRSGPALLVCPRQRQLEAERHGIMLDPPQAPCVLLLQYDYLPPPSLLPKVKYKFFEHTYLSLSAFLCRFLVLKPSAMTAK